MDFGCGDGRFSSFIGEFGETDAVELSIDAVNAANEKYPHVRFIQGNCLEIEVPESKYDVVISQEVLEHLWEQEEYLKQCFKMLKPGGFLILTTPNKWVMDHMRGGNWSNQPIENLLSFRKTKKLIGQQFRIIKADTIILNFGTLGAFRFVNHRLLIGIANRLNLKRTRENVLGRLGFGLHTVILAKKV